MKKGRYFDYKGKGYIMLNCPKKIKVFAISDILDYNIITCDQLMGPQSSRFDTEQIPNA